MPLKVLLSLNAFNVPCSDKQKQKRLFAFPDAAQLAIEASLFGQRGVRGGGGNAKVLMCSLCFEHSFTSEMQSKGGRHQIHAAQLKFLFSCLFVCVIKTWKWNCLPHSWNTGSEFSRSVAQCQFISLIKAHFLLLVSGHWGKNCIYLILWLLYGVYSSLVQTETFYFSNAFYE